MIALFVITRSELKIQRNINTFSQYFISWLWAMFLGSVPLIEVYPFTQSRNKILMQIIYIWQYYTKCQFIAVGGVITYLSNFPTHLFLSHTTYHRHSWCNKLSILSILERYSLLSAMTQLLIYMRVQWSNQRSW